MAGLDLLLIGLLTMSAASTAMVTCRSPNLTKLRYCDPNLSIADRVEDLLPRLTLAEKLGQMSMVGPNISRLGMIEYNFGGEALHGVWSNCYVSADNKTTRCPTQFPAPLTMGASFNASLWVKMASASSSEARGLYGVHDPTLRSLEGTLGLSFYAPNINLMRDPRWGRNEEVPSEDPLVNGVYGSSFTKGFQYGGEVPAVENGYYLKASVTVKHYAVYNLEQDFRTNLSRHSFNAIVSEQDLYETYLKPFQIAVKAKPAAVMCSYNAINGIPACVNKKLLKDVLRESFKFEGVIATDCGALEDTMVNHNYTKTGVETVALAIEASVDSNCGDYYQKYLPNASKSGLLSMVDVDAAARRLLTLRFKLGLFELGNKKVPHASITEVNSVKHQQLALEAAQQGIVLLKNEKPAANELPLLPLSKSRFRSVAMIGPNANASMNLLSGYHGTPPFLRSPLLAMQEEWGNENVRYSVGCNMSGPTDPMFLDAAVNLAENVDLVIVGLGLCGDNYNGGPPKEDATCFHIDEAEATDRTNLTLPGSQLELLKRVAATGTPTVLFLINAGPVDISWAKEHVNSIVSAGYGGEQGGKALVDVLTGVYNPGGALPYSLVTNEWAEATRFDSMEMRPSEFVPAGRTYRFLNESHRVGKPLYSFGFGLSYTTFKLEWTTPPPTHVQLNETVRFDTVITNEGTREGEVVAMCYISAVKIDGIDRSLLPVKQLFSFHRTPRIKSKAQAKFEVELTAGARSFTDRDGHAVEMTGEMMVRCEAGGIVAVESKFTVAA